MKTTTVYHGTKAQFDTFNTDYVFFTTSKQMAQSYGNILIEKEIDFSGITEIDAKGAHWKGIRLGEDFAKEIYADMVAKDFVYYSMDDLTKDRFPTDSVVYFAKELGKDFIKICNVVDYGSEVSNPIPCDVFVIINKDLLK